MGATPFGQIPNELASFGRAVKTNKLTKTPRETNQLEPVKREEGMGRIMNTQQVAAKPKDQPNYSPMLVGMGQPKMGDLASGNVSSFDDDTAADKNKMPDALRNQD